jgi:hypothetical protein
MRSSSLCRASLRGREVGRGLLAAAPVGLNVVGDRLTLREAAHPTRIRDQGAEAGARLTATLRP